MPSFGQKLKQEREKRSVTLEQISLTTKIGTRMLQALEDEKFNQLPGGIFNKGFVRAYARHLGIDEDQAVADYLEASGEGVPPKIDPGVEPAPVLQEPSPAAPSKPLPWGLFAAILLVVALALSIWSHRQQKQVGSGAKSSPAPALQNLAADPVSSPPSTSGVIASGTGLGHPATTATVQPVSSSSPTPTAAAPIGKVAPKPTATPPKAPAATGSSDEFTVVVQVQEESWVSVKVDGKIILAGTLSSGTQRSIRGQKEVVIVAGNSGGIDFVFNGKRLGRQGESGEVKTLTFGPGGLQANAPAPAVTQ